MAAAQRPQAAAMEQQGTWFGASGAMGVSGTALLKHLHTGFLQDSWGLAAPWVTARLQKQLLHLLYWKGQRVCADTTVLVSKKKNQQKPDNSEKKPNSVPAEGLGLDMAGAKQLGLQAAGACSELASHGATSRLREAGARDRAGCPLCGRAADNHYQLVIPQTVKHTFQEAGVMRPAQGGRSLPPLGALTCHKTFVSPHREPWVPPRPPRLSAQCLDQTPAAMGSAGVTLGVCTEEPWPWAAAGRLKSPPYPFGQPPLVWEAWGQSHPAGRFEQLRAGGEFSAFEPQTIPGKRSAAKEP